MSDRPTITFVTVCKARLAHLRQSLPAAAKQAACVVVDYACPEGTGDWVSENHPAVALVRIDASAAFSVAAGRNAGAAAAKGDWLCFLDADVVPDADFARAITPLLKPGHFYRPCPVSADLWGTVICARSDFERVGGYDAAFDGWGGEDDDFYHRLQLGDVTPAQFPAYLLSAIPHDDATRMRFHAIKDREIGRRLNFAYIQMKNDVRAMLGAEPGPALRSAMFAEVRRVLSDSLRAGGQAQISVNLPDSALLPGWQASRTLVYTFPPAPLTPPNIGPAVATQPQDAAGRPPMPFIVGTGRCGSTLLRLMLDSHPDLAIPDEILFMPALIRSAMNGARAEELVRLIASHHSWPSFRVDAREVQTRALSASGTPLAGVLRAFYDCYASRFGKKRSGDKTIINTKHVGLLAAVLPEARFVHLVRDGRDVAVSMRGLWFGIDVAADAASYWATTILNVRASVDGARYLEIRYEDLVDAPEQTLRKVCDFIKLPWESRMLEYHFRAAERLAESPDGVAWDGRRIPANETRSAHSLTQEPPTTARVGTWKRALGADEIAEFELIAGPLLTALGYERSH